MVVKYARAGKIEKLKAIAVSERKKIKALLKSTIPLSGTRIHLASRIHLCPSCAQKLDEGKYICGNCNLKFKSKRVAAISSILIPGWGYFYVRHYLLGALSAILEIFLILYSAFLINDPINHVQFGLNHLMAVPLIYLYVKIASLFHSIHFVDEFISGVKCK